MSLKQKALYYIDLDTKLANSPKALVITLLLLVPLCIFIIYYQATQELLLNRAPYDIDGWGHLVMQLSNGAAHCSFSLSEAYNSNRGILLPYIFAQTYCINNSLENIQILNGLFHIIGCSLVTFVLSKYFNSIFLGIVAALLWSIWPAYNFMYSYYFSEQIGGLLILISFVLLITPQKNWLNAALIGLLLAILLHVRSSAILMVIVSLCLFAYTYKSYKKNIATCFIIFISVYATLPIANYLHFEKIIPFTTQGGFALHEGTYLPGDDLPASALRSMSEFNERELKTKDMNNYEADKYWKSLARKNIEENPIGQIKLAIKKGMRFWTNTPGFSWLPTTKSLVVSIPLFILWLCSFLYLKNWPIFVANSLVLSIWAVHTLVHSEYRYSYVVLPLIILSAGYFTRQKIREVMINEHT